MPRKASAKTHARRLWTRVKIAELQLRNIRPLITAELDEEVRRQAATTFRQISATMLEAANHLEQRRRNEPVQGQVSENRTAT